jgi:hypothetical protein
VSLLLIFVNLAFFGIVWHAGRIVLGQADQSADFEAPVIVRERSAWMIAGMAGCLFVSVALGVHLSGDLSALPTSAAHRPAAPA